MASSAVATRSFQRPDQFTQQLSGHSVSLLSITPYTTLSPPFYSPFPTLFTMNFFCHEPEELPFISRGQGLAVLSRSGSRSSGDRGKRSSAGIPRDAQRCS